MLGGTLLLYQSACSQNVSLRGMQPEASELQDSVIEHRRHNAALTVHIILEFTDRNLPPTPLLPSHEFLCNENKYQYGGTWGHCVPVWCCTSTSTSLSQSILCVASQWTKTLPRGLVQGFSMRNVIGWVRVTNESMRNSSQSNEKLTLKHIIYYF